MAPLNLSELGVNGLPTGTVTLALGDVVGSTPEAETRPEELTPAIARLDRAVSEAIALHRGHPLYQRGNGGFAAAFSRATDAVACALDLQRAPLAPIQLRIGVRTGEVQLGDDGRYAGPAIDRAARLRDLAHGGQTVLSGATEPLVVDRLPEGAWLNDLGRFRLGGLQRIERVVQLCHPDLHNEFPPLRTTDAPTLQNLPVQLTSFVGRSEQISEVRLLLTDHRLLTLAGAGGVGKTRLATQVAAQMVGDFDDGVWFVDLASIATPDVVPVAVARALGLRDQPGTSTLDTLQRFVSGRQMLVVLDNCEHLLDASAAVVVALLGAAPELALLTTSREPIGAAGEMIWRVPSLSLADEATQLFNERARHARPDFAADAESASIVTEICRRLDGMPLAIELAAARVRVLSLTEIRDGLRDRFRLLTGGVRTATRRQQTLRASVEWSHELLSSSERTLFRRLAVFLGGFDFDAAQAVCGGDALEHHEVLGQLSLLVDKSLVVAAEANGRTRFRLLETIRQYAQQKLSESGEADTFRSRHRDHYTSMVIALDTPGTGGYDERLELIEAEIDNLRAAFAWSRDAGDAELALRLVSALQPLWLIRGRMGEGRSWCDAILPGEGADDSDVAPAVLARALADKAVLDSGWVSADSLPLAQRAVAIARDLDDQALLAHALTACAATSAVDTEAARPFFAEAIALARSLGDRWRLSQVLGWQAYSAFIAGDPVVAQAAGEEGRGLADAVGDDFVARQCRCWGLGAAQIFQGNLAAADAELRALAAEAEAAGDTVHSFLGHLYQAYLQAWRGQPNAARAEAQAAIDAAAQVGDEYYMGHGHMMMVAAEMAADDLAAAATAAGTAWQRIRGHPGSAATNLWRFAFAALALARGDLSAARDWADQAVAGSLGWHRALALAVRTQVAVAHGEIEQANRDAHDALRCAVDAHALLAIADILECLAGLAAGAADHREAARLFGAANAIRAELGIVRLKLYDAVYDATVQAVRIALSDNEFELAFAEGAAMSTGEAIAYAQRGRGERKRPKSGWESLTPAERDVVRLVTDGLANKDVAARLFVSPRTVETHLTHVYAKLGLTSRVQLVQEAARHA